MTGLIVCGVLVVVVGFALLLAAENARLRDDLNEARGEIRRLRVSIIAKAYRDSRLGAPTGNIVTHTAEVPVTIPVGTRMHAWLKWNA